MEGFLKMSQCKKGKEGSVTSMVAGYSPPPPFKNWEGQRQRLAGDTGGRQAGRAGQAGRQARARACRQERWRKRTKPMPERERVAPVTPGTGCWRASSSPAAGRKINQQQNRQAGNIERREGEGMGMAGRDRLLSVMSVCVCVCVQVREQVQAKQQVVQVPQVLKCQKGTKHKNV